jgi:hypothetical protein
MTAVCPECSWPLQPSSRVPGAAYCPNDFRDCRLSGVLTRPVAA